MTTVPCDVPAPKPSAAPVPRRRRLLGSRATWLVLAAIALVAGVFVGTGYQHWNSAGSAVTIRFGNAHGLRPGSEVRYRGVAVGRVTEVRLLPDLGQVEVRATLAPEGEALALEGSRFWIVRPSLSLTSGVSGLDTVVADNYIAVRPAAGGARATEFVGADAAPTPESDPAGLPVVLTAKRGSFALRQGAPVTCCGMPVGLVEDVKLADNGKGVRATARIDKAHAHLVTLHCRFYENDVLRPELNFLKGSVKLGLDLQALSGGLDLEVPDKPDKRDAPAPAGHVFPLSDRGERN